MKWFFLQCVYFSLFFSSVKLRQCITSLFKESSEILCYLTMIGQFFTSNKPILRKPLMCVDSQNQPAPESEVKYIPSAPYVLRRFPKLKKGGGMMVVLNKNVVAIKWINPLSRLKSVLEAGFQNNQILLIPNELWKPIAAGVKHVPVKIAERMNPNRGYKANLIRSPERVMGVADVIGRNARIRLFELIDAINLSYTRDLRFVIVFCLLLGFEMWWYLLPETLLNHTIVCYSAEYANAFLDAQECIHLKLGHQRCLHQGVDHNLVLELFKEQEVFDPLSIKPEKRTWALAFMYSVIILTLALSESVTVDWIML